MSENAGKPVRNEAAQRPPKCPGCGIPMLEKDSRYGKLWECGRCGRILSQEIVKRPCPYPYCTGYLIDMAGSYGSYLKCIKCGRSLSYSSYNRYR